MSKKILSLLLAAILAFAMSLNVFAAEPEGIAPFDSRLVVELTTTNWVTVYTGEVPYLFALNGTVTNHINNPGAIYMRIISDEGTILNPQRQIDLGSVANFSIEANAAEEFQIQVMAVDTASAYGIIVSLGDQGEDIQIVSIGSGITTTIYTGETPTGTTDPDTLIVTNHMLSPGTAVFSFEYENGTEVVPQIILAPGESQSVDISYVDYNRSTTYMVKVTALNVNGTYFVSVTQ